MKLLTKELREILPPLYAQENTKDPIVYAKFFLHSYTWYVTEFDGEDLFFGYVVGQFSEWGYFSLNELESVCVYGLKTERDLWFEPCPLSTVKG